ncbi:hypothetical protein [Streptomyces adelaidensis]|nr:hypothetical protein [Streptomyces adelaidensis]
MIFPVPKLVACLSAICPLRPGDLIFHRYARGRRQPPHPAALPHPG